MRNRNYTHNDRPRLTAIQLINTVIGILLLFALALGVGLLLAGCAGEDSATESPADSRAGSAIAFSVGDSTARAATRAAQGTIDLAVLKTKGFGVFACHTGVHPYVSTSTTANLMWNQLVSYNGSAGQWEYEPLVYWPNGEEGVEEYVTFFAYAPHSDNANGCIADMSRSDETGDPWILYQLGGSETDWKSSQVDLLYDFRKDQQKDDSPSVRVGFEFKHALACVGDRITVTCDESVAERLKGVYEGTPVLFTVNRVTIDYLLTRKGRLVLNGSTQPNWQAVESEDAKVHRTLTFTPNLVMAQATSATAADIYTFDSDTGHGIFYIPLESGTDKQRATVTIDYTVSSGSPAEVTEEGSAESTIDLSFVSNPSEGRDLNITFRLPDPGVSLASATVGMVIGANGKAYNTIAQANTYSTAAAIIAYKGNGEGDSNYNNGLAISLADVAGEYQWKSSNDGSCTTQNSDFNTIKSDLNGLAHTATLCSAGHNSHGHDAAVAANGYTSTMAKPANCSTWFLPTIGQWKLIVEAMCGGTGLTTSGQDTYKAANFNKKIRTAYGVSESTACASDVQAYTYWSSVEYNTDYAWFVRFFNGRVNYYNKSNAFYVRPVLAF